MDGESKSLPLTQIDYQFRSEVQAFTITPHGNSKSSNKSFIKTQKSALDDLKENVKHNLQPRIAMNSVNSVSENRGGINLAPSSGSILRNINQVYNLSKSKAKSLTQTMTNDPYLDLIIKCKQQCMDPKATFIQKVICAPGPIAVLCTENQLNNIEKFCSNEIKFGVFQVDHTFDLGPFSVTATAY